MEYERIDKRHIQLSPRKLRSMLLGAEKKRREEIVEDQELESATLSLRSQLPEIHDSGCNLENCKDVNVVSIVPESSTSLAVDTSASLEMMNDMRIKDQSLVNSRIRSQDDSILDCDSGFDSISTISPLFEFQKAERAAQRVPIAPFSKPAPSKWDDAQKWIASPTSNRPRTGQSSQVVGSRKTSYSGYGYRQQPTKVVIEVPDQQLVPYEEPVDTKQIDSGQPKDSGVQKFVSWEAEPYPIAESYAKPVLMIENSIGQSAINLSRHDSSVSIHSATVIPQPSTARSVSMRDMGTEMTPIASQEPSRTGTPVRATTPTRSPTSSRPSTPGAAPASSPFCHLNDNLEAHINDLTDQELQMKTRREIMALGTKLGKMNIAAWAGKDGEDRNASSLLKTDKREQPTTTVTERRAAAWEDAEKAKYMARFKREEIKIQAWENHQQAKTEAEMRKIEVEVEKMRARAQDKLMNKLAAVRHKAEEKLAAAEARRNNHAVKIEKQAEYIRKTGRLPRSFSCCRWCF
ncbi:PREDICTED: uncharacterized protein LOC109232859 isoform X2 [Nicotiana attenuata]|uniref:Remorin n=1 Tax=Nicotiana attenuata TaxID=49451 RepID=A0A1J6JJT7_NICAT|nr:PREDICTED: uncharacterized protein LOC109232859 isoform X2 [Nicotiana attenuata]OIT07201.1 remorin [Nicotiana attenuata]